jgi:hypothetical protein
MPDTRRHRGPHPADAELFRREAHSILNKAVAHLSWLLTRGYPQSAALKLVGDRFRLAERQRRAVMRCSCSDDARDRRRARQVITLAGKTLHIDGFNVLTSIEAAQASGVILHGRDGCFRDMASMHGSYRKVHETIPALRLVGAVLERLQVAHCRWLLDSPVSNSGRLSGLIRDAAAENGWSWTVELVMDPDRVLIAEPLLVASADSQILDACVGWFNLTRTVIEQNLESANIIKLTGDSA